MTRTELALVLDRVRDEMLLALEAARRDDFVECAKRLQSASDSLTEAVEEEAA